MLSALELLTIFPISFYSPQMVATVDTTKYAIENDLTKKRKRRKKASHRQIKQNGICRIKEKV